MFRLRPVVTLTVALLWISQAPEARAEVCGAVGGQVECLDAQTLGWCDQGKLETITCPSGEICTHHEVFEGGYGCVPIEDTACGDIPLEGMCTSGNTVVWCDDAGDLQLKACDEGTECGWDDSDGWYDCLPGTLSGSSDAGPTEPGSMPWDTSLDTATYDSSNGSQNLGPIPDSVLNGEPDGGPTPSLSAGGESPQSNGPGDSGGCQGARDHSGALSALVILLLLAVRRRVADDLYGRSAP